MAAAPAQGSAAGPGPIRAGTADRDCDNRSNAFASSVVRMARVSVAAALAKL